MILEARIKLLTDGEALRGVGVDKRNEQTRGTGDISERIQIEMMDSGDSRLGCLDDTLTVVPRHKARVRKSASSAYSRGA